MSRGGRAAPARRSEARSRITHVPALDGLRGLAVLAVLAFHGGHLQGGFLGVDLFFVLSGYLITALLLAEGATGDGIDLVTFWARRCRRLLPALFVLLLVVTIAAQWLADPLQWRAIRDDGLATLAYVANWHTIWTGQVYGGGIGGRSPLEHTWSLAIEEQFYVLWPLLVAFLTRRGRTPQRVLRWSLGIGAVSATAMVVGSLAGVSPNTLYLGTHTRIAAVAMGAALAAWQALDRPAVRPVDARLVAAAGWWALAALLVAWTTIALPDTLLYRGGLAACGLAATVLLWSITRVGAAWGPAVVLRHPALRAFGLRSYGLYLYHWPIFVWLDEARTGLDGWGLFAIRVAASCAAAWLSYALLEQPIRHARSASRPVYRTSAVGACCIAAVLVAGALQAPAPLAVQGEQQGSLADPVADTGAPQLAIFGDSVAEIFASQGAAAVQGDHGVVVRDGGNWGCNLMAPEGAQRNGVVDPLPPERSRSCALGFRDTVTSLDPAPRYVMMFFGGIPYDVDIDGAWVHPCQPDYIRRYRTRAEAAIRDLGAGGAAVTVVLPAPSPDRVGISSEGMTDMTARQACLWGPLKETAEALGVGIVDLRDRLCHGDEACEADGSPDDLRRDGLHYEHEAAVELARYLVPEAVRVAKPVG